MSWTAGNSETQWDIELGVSGFSATGTPTQSGVTNSYTYTGLSAVTSYDYYVQADCGGDVSLWVGPFNFTTPACDPASQCDYEFIVTDSQDDSWDGGAHISVTQGGIEIALFKIL